MLSNEPGSASLTTHSSGNKLSELRYQAWGEVRYSSGTTATKYTYIGQYSNVADFGLMFYNARWYDPTIGRFVQPDTIISEGVQGHDRYAYVNNGPSGNTDSSGHFVTILGGAAIGAIAGAAIYTATTLATGRDFHVADLGVAALVGAAGGALIGTGVGIGAGVAPFACVGAGTGALGSQLGYSIASGAKYDSGEMAIAAGVGAAAGAVSGGLDGSAVAGTGTAFMTNVAANGAAGSAQYALTQLYRGEQIDPYAAARIGVASSVSTMVVNGPGFVLQGGSELNSAAYWSSVSQNRFAVPTMASTARSIAGQRLVGGTLTGVARSALEYGLAEAQ